MRGLKILPTKKQNCLKFLLSYIHNRSNKLTSRCCFTCPRCENGALLALSVSAIIHSLASAQRASTASRGPSASNSFSPTLILSRTLSTATPNNSARWVCRKYKIIPNFCSIIAHYLAGWKGKKIYKKFTTS